MGAIEFSYCIYAFENCGENTVKCAPLLVANEVFIFLKSLFLLFNKLSGHGELFIIFESVDGLAKLLELAQELLVFPGLVFQFVFFL